MDVFLLKVLQGPKALHARLVAVVSCVGRIKGADDGKQLRIFGFERCCQCCCGSMLSARNDLPLVDQIGVASEWRGAPGVGRNTNASVGQGLGTHANFDTRCHAGLASVNGRHAQTRQPLTPSAVGQNHGLCHHQVEGRAALTRADLNPLLAGRRLVARVSFQTKVVVGSVEVFGFAANHFTAGFEVLRQTPEKRQAVMGDGQHGLAIARSGRGVFQPFLRDPLVELVMSQVGFNGHPL